MSTSLLIPDNPLIVLPKLAVAFGLEEAIVVQQVYYWLRKNEAKEMNLPLGAQDHFREGRWWTYNSYAGWQEQFPFWSVQKVGRVFRSAEEQGLLLSRQFEVRSWNQRKWYSISDEQLRQFSVPVGKTNSKRTSQKRR